MFIVAYFQISAGRMRVILLLVKLHLDNIWQLLFSSHRVGEVKGLTLYETVSSSNTPVVTQNCPIQTLTSFSSIVKQGRGSLSRCQTDRPEQSHIPGRERAVSCKGYSRAARHGGRLRQH